MLFLVNEAGFCLLFYRAQTLMGAQERLITTLDELPPALHPEITRIQRMCHLSVHSHPTSRRLPHNTQQNFNTYRYHERCSTLSFVPILHLFKFITFCRFFLTVDADSVWRFGNFLAGFPFIAVILFMSLICVGFSRCLFCFRALALTL